VRHCKTLAGLIAAALLLPASVQAGGREKEKEAPAELEIGAAAEWAIPGGGVGFGASVGIEYTLIKDWLEVELAGRTGTPSSFSKSPLSCPTR
jgi:hypothetical protein